MITKEEVDLAEENAPEMVDFPEVEVRGGEAVIRLSTPEAMEERKVKLPKTVWG